MDLVVVLQNCRNKIYYLIIKFLYHELVNEIKPASLNYVVCLTLYSNVLIYKCDISNRILLFEP